MPVGAAAEDCFYVSVVDSVSRRSALKRGLTCLRAQAGVSGWTADGSPLMVERLGRADLAGITREGEDLQRLVLYRRVPSIHCGRAGFCATCSVILDLACVSLAGIGRYMLCGDNAARAIAENGQ